ncbi:MAG TPA: D-2-hydroxyacid dehydrogenase [Candidatus Dormibacteraeota bacterium]|nr:D-2-hydroxyacid dehydrogenase [Candidatus Dormibacteraeota bacterium]
MVLSERFRPHLEHLPSDVETAWYTDQDTCAAALPGVEVLWIDNTLTSIEDAIGAGTDLRWLTTHGTGVDGWPLELFERRGLVLTNGAGIGAIPISEYVVMAILAGLKALPELVRAQDRREWLGQPPAFGELHGKRALIYGYGSIGRAIGHRLKPFGVLVTGVRRHLGDAPGVISVEDWEARLPETDLLILSVPLTGSTRALVGEAQLAALPQGAWVVNIARGNLIDEAALISALKSGRLGGAYLDVTKTEPLPPDSELWSLPNVILTPHSSWASNEFRNRAAVIFLDNLDRYRRKEPLRNVVDLSAGY